ncbi:hypothetical protein RBH29_08645 [Herbivorax sp. ANBcel31]|uniref:hypothetical protein n=1 Tax=Herbivorax sp. ANBcel31 TaxID=3069754 RepID=UPI0027B66399|nr:hypothetical protein [Herbivorax sp. ANBcel31]MDQ2086494.1 hypothetical protein [Herbivorax sp. ANBcel31]
MLQIVKRVQHGKLIIKNNDGTITIGTFKDFQIKRVSGGLTCQCIWVEKNRVVKLGNCEEGVPYRITNKNGKTILETKEEYFLSSFYI